MVNGASASAEADESAEGTNAQLVVLVVPVRVAVLEVLGEGVVARVLRDIELSTSPRRGHAEASGETAPDQSASCCCSPVSVVRMAVGLCPSGSTGFIGRTGVRALTVMLQAR
jgi:hypothetical protein